MKTRWLLPLPVLALAACSKSASKTAGSLPPTEEKSGAVAAPQTDVAAVPPAEEAATNQRTLALPRPPDVKHKAPEPEAPTAKAVPGKAGFVFSPFNNKIINVSEIPPGTLVQDPTITGDSPNLFRIP